MKPAVPLPRLPSVCCFGPRGVFDSNLPGKQTSGKVPLEKTLLMKWLVTGIAIHHSWSSLRGREIAFLHQETSFSTGTVTHDNEFAADFSHDGNGGS